MKRLVAFYALITALLFPSTSLADDYADSVIDDVINGAEMDFTPNAILVNGVTMVPVREIFEAYGATVSWEPKTKTITAMKGETTI